MFPLFSNQESFLGAKVLCASLTDMASRGQEGLTSAKDYTWRSIHNSNLLQSLFRHSYVLGVGAIARCHFYSMSLIVVISFPTIFD